jgi:hypothetical protein
MAIIQSYPITHNIKASDLLLGVANISSTERPEYITTSFRIGDIAASASTIAASYGILYLPQSSIVLITTVGAWQPIGLVATLVSPSPGFSLGTTDKCALKNISGSTKTVNFSCNAFSSIASGFEYANFALALNGVLIDGTATTSGYGWSLDWVVVMQDGDEVSTYVRSQYNSSGTVYNLRMTVSEI